MIQHSASRIAKTINKPLKSRLSLPTLAMMTKRQEIVENGDDKQRMEHPEIGKTIKMKAKEDISKYNQDIICETIRQTDHTSRQAG